MWIDRKNPDTNETETHKNHNELLRSKLLHKNLLNIHVPKVKYTANAATICFHSKKCQRSLNHLTDGSTHLDSYRPMRSYQTRKSVVTYRIFCKSPLIVSKAHLSCRISKHSLIFLQTWQTSEKFVFSGKIWVIWIYKSVYPCFRSINFFFRFKGKFRIWRVIQIRKCLILCWICIRWVILCFCIWRKSNLFFHKSRGTWTRIGKKNLWIFTTRYLNYICCLL